ncbi:hypothetical protein [Anaerovorax sp. IOR16]|uniref:hypothetical protein n=1 Tax=Anaerovorax sp. IOR16 TaxID=2773458 RepID=UPI0019D01090|nr:hypothetical protein [Anaerovorax sp. IOR16]
MYNDYDEFGFVTKAQEPMPNVPMPSPNSPLVLPGEPNPSNKPGLIPIFQYLSGVYQKYLKDETNIGYLKVNVISATDSEPIPNAKITISQPLGNNYFISQIEFTDQNGEIPLISLPTRSAELSQTPTYPVPYTTWNLTAEANGYYEVILYDIPIFPDITTVQSFSLKPIENNQIKPIEEIYASQM